MIMSKEGIIDDLETRYDIILNSQIEPLILAESIAGYCKTLLDNDITTKMVEELGLIASEEYRRYYDTYIEFLNTLNRYLNFVRSLPQASSLEIDVPNPSDFVVPVGVINLKKELDFLKSVKNQILNSSDEITAKKISVHEDNLHETYWATREIEKAFGTLGEIEIWGAMYHLVSIYQAVVRNWDFNYLNRPHFDIQGCYVSELEDIRNNKTQNLKMLTKNRISSKITLIHKMLIKRLRETDGNPSITNKPIPIPKQWSIKETEDGSALVLKNLIEVFKFPRRDSDKYKYFKKLLDNYGCTVTFRSLYEATGLNNYPTTIGLVNSMNKKIRNKLNKLKSEIKKKGAPIFITERKGWSLILD